MTTLHYTHTGRASYLGQSWGLRLRPALGFDFDTIDFEDGAGSKTLAGQSMALTPGEIEQSITWLQANNPHANNSTVVHGADSEGNYLGRVAPGAAAHVLRSGPPAGTGWVWAAGQWAKVPTFAEALAQALPDIDRQADALTFAVVGQRFPEYQTAQTKAGEYKASGYSGPVPASVGIWAHVKGQSNQWAADDILAVAGQWQTAMQAIRAVRLSAKEQVRASNTTAQITAHMGTVRTHFGAIRQSLGVPEP